MKRLQLIVLLEEAYNKVKFGFLKYYSYIYDINKKVMRKSREKVIAAKVSLITIGFILSILYPPLLVIALIGLLGWIAFN